MFKNICIPIQANSNCLSEGIIYIIKCSLCNVFYIGQSSKNAKTRINQHLNNILFFKKNVSKSLINFYNLSEVAIHFSSIKHDFSNFSFFIFNSNILNDSIRLSQETDLINIFINLNIPILNKKIPSFFNLTNLTFSDKY